ncbi:MAG: hypothetical protein JKY88_09450 [Pseudomonadales bacterium]|nr:hypothetical protein [Pseudomonadales bacterium]
MPDLKVLVLFALVFALSYLGSRLYQYYAIKIGLLANVNVRSAHELPTPTGSGLVLLKLFLVSIILLWYWQLITVEMLLACLGPIFVGAVGYVDDKSDLPVKVRMPLYMFAAVWSVYILGFPVINISGMEIDLGLLGLVLGVMSLFWLQNLFNFMDGVDGIASIEVVFVCFSAVWIGCEAFNGLSSGWSLLGILIGILALGYLMTNWPPARMFMGDAGSNFFGLMLGVFVLGNEAISVWVWMILLSQFIVDACLTVSIRLIKHQKIYESHSQHAYQHLNRRYGTNHVLQLMIIVNFIWLLPIAYLAHEFPDMGFILLLLASLPLVLLYWLSGAGKTEPRMARLRVK